MVVDNTRLVWEPSRSGRYVERFDRLFKRRADAATVLVFAVETVLGGVQLVNVVDHVDGLRGCRLVRRSQRWVILKLKSGLLLIFLESMGDDAGCRRDIVTLHGTRWGFQLADNR